ncbi:hypothetical protein BGZ67_007112 [Mortierella alpina]|nr:hypothetical protein BGZ67_007112 [Mortierella alpina]
MSLQNWANERISAARKKDSAIQSQVFLDALQREEVLYKRIAKKLRKRAPDGLHDITAGLLPKKLRKRAPDGLHDITVGLLREEHQLSAIDLDKSKINNLFQAGEEKDGLLSIWTRTINGEKMDTCWTNAVRLQGRSDGSGAVTTEEEEEEEEEEGGSRRR